MELYICKHQNKKKPMERENSERKENRKIENGRKGDRENWKGGDTPLKYSAIIYEIITNKIINHPLPFFIHVLLLLNQILILFFNICHFSIFEQCCKS